MPFPGLSPLWQELFARLLALLLLLGGISTPVAPPATAVQTPAPAAPGLQSIQPDLREALSFAPPEADLLAFTSWQTIKLHQSAGKLTSASSMAERRDFLRSLTLGETAASAFALAYFARQAEQWGWDTTDLLWEATVQGEGAPVFILRLRDDFDMAGLLARFEERDFAKAEHAGALVYTHRLDLTVDWRTELAVFNAAVLPDAKILIHASDASALPPVLDAHADGANWQRMVDVLSVAATFGPTSAALIAPGGQLCTEFGFEALLPALLGDVQLSADQLAALQRKYFGDVSLQPYQALGISYRYVAARLEGIVTMHYASRAGAEADLEARRQLAANGESLSTRAPIREVLFFDPIATVLSDNIVLNVRPADDRPQRLFNMFYRRDMPFAACF